MALFENMEKLSFIGPGVMAEAIARNLVQADLITAEQVIMSGPNETRLADLDARYEFSTISDNRKAVQQAAIVVLSVKPQSLSLVLDELAGKIAPGSLVISIVAGAKLDSISDRLRHPAVVRCMPNTPAQIGEGITVWMPTASVSTEHLELSRKILQSLGDEILVNDEDYLDMATALSGTGPAYTFLFMEAMVDAGVHLGFPRRIAEQLVIRTVKGSVAYYDHTPRHLARLRNQVTSPGGTSAEALYYLEKAGFRTALSRAIWAAYERSVQLGKGKKRGAMDDSQG
ncbi:MAG: pyrroline-5-carboxylate reductase [Anaerolineales bacterium]|nr:MAG: pyrroline-5-carboxylate reductase [Anaerolineales bacterium]